MSAIALTFLSAGLGLAFTIIYEVIKRIFSTHGELRDNGSINVSGLEWHVAWQTSVDGQENINTERLEIKQRGKRVKMRNLARSPENPKGGYLWEARMHFYHGRHLMGWYLPLKRENIASKGIMFCAYQSSRKIFYGKWVGASHDGDLACGYFVISHDRQRSLTELKHILETHKETVNIISNTM